MTKEEAFEILINIKNTFEYMSDERIALAMAIDAFKVEVDKDISTNANENHTTNAEEAKSCKTCNSYTKDSSDEYMTCSVIGYIEWNKNMSADKFCCDFYSKENK